MNTPLDRLYPGRVVQSTLHRDALPVPIRRIVRHSCISDDQLIGFVVWVGCGLALSILGAALFGLPLALVVLAAVVFGPLVVAWSRKDMRAKRIEDGLPDMVHALTRSLRSGASFQQGLAETSSKGTVELAEEIAVVLESVNRGQSLAIAFTQMAARVPVDQVHVAAASLALASENEAGAVEALEGLSQSLRDRAALAKEVKALSAQATASMRAMILLPSGFLLLDVLGSQRAVRFLMNEPLGRWCLTLGIGLNFVGAIWMRRLFARAMA